MNVFGQERATTKVGVLHRKLKVLKQLLLQLQTLEGWNGAGNGLDGPVSDGVNESWHKYPDKSAKQFCIALHYVFS